MRIAINQPYFFPYLGYFSLIKHTDQFVIFDLVQFVRQSWIRRNRILSQCVAWSYFSVPVIKSSRETLIKDILIDNRQNWKQANLNLLEVYKKVAPHYTPVLKLLNDLFANDFTDIVSLNKASLEIVCDFLEIRHNFHELSKMDLTINKPEEPGEWPLNICKAFGNVVEYWNLPKGRLLYDIDTYNSAGLTIKFPKNNLRPYDQKKEIFEPGLSIIDVMMFNDKSEVHDMIDDFGFI